MLNAVSNSWMGDDPAGHFHRLREVRHDGSDLKVHGVDERAARKRIQRAVPEALRGGRRGIRLEIEDVRGATLHGLHSHDLDHEPSDELREPPPPDERIVLVAGYPFGLTGLRGGLLLDALFPALLVFLAG